MGKTIKITESQLQRVVKNIQTEKINTYKKTKSQLNEEINQEIDEGLASIWDKIKEPFQKAKYGIKGMGAGVGYKFLPFVVMVRNLLKELKRLDRPNERVMMKLDNLKLRIRGMYLDEELKNDLLFGIEKVQKSFRTYATAIDEMTVVLNQTLSTNPSTLRSARNPQRQTRQSRTQQQQTQQQQQQQQTQNQTTSSIIINPITGRPFGNP